MRTALCMPTLLSIPPSTLTSPMTPSSSRDEVVGTIISTKTRNKDTTRDRWAAIMARLASRHLRSKEAPGRRLKGMARRVIIRRNSFMSRSIKMEELLEEHRIRWCCKMNKIQKGDKPRSKQKLRIKNKLNLRTWPGCNLSSNQLRANEVTQVAEECSKKDRSCLFHNKTNNINFNYNSSKIKSDMRCKSKCKNN